MEQTGMIRQFDSMGRIVVPKDIRERHGWGEGSPVEIIPNGDEVIIKSYRPNEEKKQDVAALEEAISHLKDTPSSEETIARLKSLIDRMK